MTVSDPRVSQTCGHAVALVLRQSNVVCLTCNFQQSKKHFVDVLQGSSTLGHDTRLPRPYNNSIVCCILA